MKTQGILKPVLVFTMLTSSIFASNCPQAVPASTPEFCGSFQHVAQCHCQASGLPAKMCQNVTMVYKRMVNTFGSLERACQYQKDTSYETCIEDWRCYQQGGLTNDGQLCNGSGLACS